MNKGENMKKMLKIVALLSVMIGKFAIFQSTDRSDLPSYFSKPLKRVWFSLFVLDKSLTVALIL